jgi:hypothetical protein
MKRGDDYMKFDVLQSQSSSKTLRMPHQQEAVDRLNKYFNLDNPEGPQSGLLVMPTGERVIIVMGALNALESKVSGTLNRYISRIT